MRFREKNTWWGPFGYCLLCVYPLWYHIKWQVSIYHNQMNNKDENIFWIRLLPNLGAPYLLIWWLRLIPIKSAYDVVIFSQWFQLYDSGLLIIAWTMWCSAVCKPDIKETTFFNVFRYLYEYLFTNISKCYHTLFFCFIFTSQIVLYFLTSTILLSFSIDIHIMLSTAMELCPRIEEYTAIG